MTDLWLTESPIEMIVGETVTFSVNFLGTTAVSSPVVTVYHKKSGVTSVAMPSGSASASGTVATMPPLVAVEAHAGTLIVVLQVTRGSNTEIRKLKVRIVKPSEES
jgi:hypothetical protein